jgi:hypothetical protein
MDSGPLRSRTPCQGRRYAAEVVTVYAERPYLATWPSGVLTGVAHPCRRGNQTRGQNRKKGVSSGGDTMSLTAHKPRFVSSVLGRMWKVWELVHYCRPGTMGTSPCRRQGCRGVSSPDPQPWAGASRMPRPVQVAGYLHEVPQATLAQRDLLGEQLSPGRYYIRWWA